MEKVGIRVFLLFVFFSFLVLFFDSRGHLWFIRNSFSYVLSPFAFVSSGIRSSADETFSVIAFWKSGEQRIKNLEQNNLDLMVKANRTDALEKENKLLKLQLGTKESDSFRLLPARVLGIGKEMLVGAGLNQGVKNGQTVVFKGALVGRVENALDNASFVKVISSPDSKVSVYIGSDNNIRGIVNGQFNSSLLLDQIVQTERLDKNIPIFSTGDDRKFESGLMVGKVGKVISSETDLFKKAIVIPIVDLNKLEMVFVIIGRK